MASLTGQTVSSTYDGLLKTEDNDILGASGKLITDGLGNSSGLTLSTTGDVSISGDLTVDGAILDSNGYAGDNGQILSSTGAGTDWIDLSEISGVDGSGTANYVPKWTDGDTIGNSVIYDDGTNIGIGTASPATKLEINGDIGIGRISGGYTFRETVGGGLRASMKSSSSNHLIFSVNADIEAMRITDLGNVGIGTSSPTRQLTVNGTTSSTINIKSNTTNGLSILAFGDSDDDNYSQIILDNSSNKLQIQNGGGGGITNRGITLDSNENVGIGTSSPSSFASQSNQLVVGSGSTNQGMTIYSSNTSEGNIFFADGTTGDQLYRGVLRYDHDGDFMSVFTAASERMRIDSSGNVLINKQSVNATYLPKLEISGTSNDGTEGVLIGSYLPTLTFQDFSGGSTVGQIQQDGTGLVFKNNNAERMRIDSSGNINIYDGIISGTAYSTSAVVSASTIDFTAAQVFTKTMTGNTTFSITNAQIGMVKDLYLTGDYTFSITNGKLIAGTYDGTVTNFIQIVAQTTTSFWYSISQEQA